MARLNAIESGQGVVIQPIAPRRPGQIKFQGTYWQAELAQPSYGKIDAGESIEVVGRRGITLLVVPENYAVRD